MKLNSILRCLAVSILCALPAVSHAKISVLILDGRNNHDWKATTEALRATLETTGLFDVSVSTAPEDLAPPMPPHPKVEDAAYLEAKKQRDEIVKSLRPAIEAAWVKWTVDFSKYQAVVLNYNGPEWPKPMQAGFVDFVRGGGGVMLIHAANNGFPNWPEFNGMIGLGWRKGDFGKCLVIDQAGAVVECCAGEGSSHGARHPFVVTNRVPEHPVLRGMPLEWMHGSDELYHHMRGPAQNTTILASAFSDVQQRGTGRHEPVLWEVAFGKGRVLVCTMGHRWPGDTHADGLDCVGFQAVLARGVEYVATGKVTLPLPAPFPIKDQASVVTPASVSWPAHAEK